MPKQKSKKTQLKEILKTFRAMLKEQQRPYDPDQDGVLGSYQEDIEQGLKSLILQEK